MVSSERDPPEDSDKSMPSAVTLFVINYRAWERQKTHGGNGGATTVWA